MCSDSPYATSGVCVYLHLRMFQIPCVVIDVAGSGQLFISVHFYSELK